MLSQKINPEYLELMQFNDDTSVLLPNMLYFDKIFELTTPWYAEKSKEERCNNYCFNPAPYFYNCLKEIYFNAFEKGKEPVTTKIYKGENGYVIRIEDSGKGFDYKKLISLMRNNKPYYQRAGIGLSNLDHLFEQVSYEPPGNIINLQLLNMDIHLEKN